MFASCVLGWGGEGGVLSQANQSRGCLQRVDAQPVCSLDWPAFDFLPAHFLPQKEAGVLDDTPPPPPIHLAFVCDVCLHHVY